jgi:hypothetical protein
MLVEVVDPVVGLVVFPAAVVQDLLVKVVVGMHLTALLEMEHHLVVVTVVLILLLSMALMQTPVLVVEVVEVVVNQRHTWVAQVVLVLQ